MINIKGSNSGDGEGLFLDAFDIQKGDVVSLIGAGGKTSLLFHLAWEARARGLRVLVTTSTKIFLPEPEQYDVIDLSGRVFLGQIKEKKSKAKMAPGIYVAGLPDKSPGKICGPDLGLLERKKNHFDLLLIEADGAAGKSLKGWNSTEPVVPLFTSKSIGVVDIQSIGRSASDDIVHRLDIFLELTGAVAHREISLDHLRRLVCHKRGLFAQAIGKKILYLNKVESAADHRNVRSMKKALPGVKIVAGSLKSKIFLL